MPDGVIESLTQTVRARHSTRLVKDEYAANWADPVSILHGDQPSMQCSRRSAFDRLLDADEALQVAEFGHPAVEQRLGLSEHLRRVCTRGGLEFGDGFFDGRHLRCQIFE